MTTITDLTTYRRMRPPSRHTREQASLPDPWSDLSPDPGRGHPAATVLPLRKPEPRPAGRNTSVVPVWTRQDPYLTSVRIQRRQAIVAALSGFADGFRDGFDGSMKSALAATAMVETTLCYALPSLPVERAEHLAQTSAQQIVAAVQSSRPTAPAIEKIADTLLAADDRAHRRSRKTSS